jgi:hypothetical protein
VCGAGDASVCALARLIVAEGDAAIGRKDEAAATLAAIPLDRLTRPLIVALVARGGQELYRELDDRTALVELWRRVADHQAFDARTRLTAAATLMRHLSRGRDFVARARALVELQPKLNPDGEAAFLVAVERHLAPLKRDNQDTITPLVLGMFRATNSVERRHALFDLVVARAEEAGAENLAFAITEAWIASLPKDSALARRAESSYVESLIERAYIDAAAGNVAGARARFEAITKMSRWLEAHIGYLDDRIAEGRDPLADYAVRYAGKPDDPTLRFARAFVAARRLPDITDPAEFDRLSSAALADLAVAAQPRPRNVEIHQLWGYIAHRRWLQRGDRPAAVEADAHYLLAEDAAGPARKRQRAALTIDLAHLQSSVGNHALALDWLAERARLPYLSPERELLACVLRARSLWFTGAELEEAGSAASECVALVDRSPSLARFRPLILDRSALIHLALGDFARARDEYKRLLPETGRAAHTAQLGLAAAALGAGDPAATLPALDAAERAFPVAPLDRAFPATVRGRPSTAELQATAAILIAGLRAQALLRLSRFSDATVAAERRAALFRERLLRHPVDEDRIAIAETEALLAALALRQNQLDAARRHLEAGLTQMDAFRASTGTPVHETGLQLLVAYAALAADGRVPLADFTLDPARRAATAHEALTQAHNPAWRKLHARLLPSLTILAK